jgi:ComF family protein
MILKNMKKNRAKENCAALARGMLDTILPPRCPISQEIVDTQGMIAPQAWASLNFITYPLCTACGIPLEVDVGKDAVCVSCITENKSFDHARSALVYDENSRSLILGFKHGDQTHAVVSFVPWLKQAGADLLPQTDIIIPVPLHRWRLLQRRYNQAALIAIVLGKATDKAVWPNGLVRTRSTPTQGHLKAVERARNVRKAFAVHPKRDVAGKNILLIDDVYTTGSTVSECAIALKEAGAAQVNVLTLARVVRPERL